MIELPKISVQQFRKLHPDFITPLNIKIDIDQFEKDIRPYKQLFRQWGTRHTNFPRFGLPLTNLNGKLDNDIEPCCYPLDQWCEEYPEQQYWESDFKCPTEALNMPSLKSLDIIKPYMWRSALLLWNNTGHFKPHVDMYDDAITHLRLWGTNKSSRSYHLSYGKEKVRDWEPGRIYLINTLDMHEAFATEDNTYTFFLSIGIEAIEKVNESIIQFQKTQIH